MFNERIISKTTVSILHIHAGLVSTWNQITVRISGLKCQIRIKSFKSIHKMSLIIMKTLSHIDFLLNVRTWISTVQNRGRDGTPDLGQDEAFYTRPWDGRKSGAKSWGDGRITHLRPIVGRNDVISHLFRPRLWANIVGERKQKMASYKCLNFTID